MRVVDLSADFRLRDVATYEHWYVPHPHPELLERAVYGLTELYRDADRAAPSSSPARAASRPRRSSRSRRSRAAGLIADVVIDAKTGVSGAGKRADRDDPLRRRRPRTCAPYGVGAHRHMPEIDQELARARRAGADRRSRRTCVPLDQGELLSCYVTPTRPLVAGRSSSELYAARYGEEPFIELVARPPGVRDVRETNICAIHVHADERTGKLFVFAAIDNLWKGTASQAVANLNLMFGLDEGTGLR